MGNFKTYLVSMFAVSALRNQDTKMEKLDAVDPHMAELNDVGFVEKIVDVLDLNTSPIDTAADAVVEEASGAKQEEGRFWRRRRRTRRRRRDRRRTRRRRVPADPAVIAVAYWDRGNCGPNGDDGNWNWCGHTAGTCQSTVNTSLCTSQQARLLEMQGPVSDGSITIDGCQYYYFARYTCEERVEGYWQQLRDLNSGAFMSEVVESEVIRTSGSEVSITEESSTTRSISTSIEAGVPIKFVSVSVGIEATLSSTETRAATETITHGWSNRITRQTNVGCPQCGDGRKTLFQWVVRYGDHLFMTPSYRCQCGSAAPPGQEHWHTVPQCAYPLCGDVLCTREHCRAL